MIRMCAVTINVVVLYPALSLFVSRCRWLVFAHIYSNTLFLFLRSVCKFYGVARASDSQLRGLTRERLEGIIKGFREVLKRGHRSSEAFRRVERLQLDLALKLYR